MKKLKLEKIKITKLDNLNEIHGGGFRDKDTVTCDCGDDTIVTLKWLTLLEH